MASIAVVTGASSGMGKDFVITLDKEGYDQIWVIARRADRLEDLKKECETDIRILQMDLTEGIDKYKEALVADKPDVRVLVNAAGFGRFKSFMETTEEDICGMIDLNDKASALMAHATIPYMSEGAQIYQLGSGSSFQPVPYMLTYGASKAFALSFSRALNMELKPKKIHVMAVCPGWVKTEFFDRAKDDNTISYYNRWYTSEEVVRQAFKDMKKGKDLSVCGFPVRFQNFLVKLMPHSFVMKTWCKQQKHPYK